MKVRAALSLLILGMLGVGPSFGQQQQPDNNVVGYAGDLQVIPNPGLRTVTIALNAAVPFNATSNQLVLVLQGQFKDYPDAWHGKGRLLVTRDYVGVVRASSGGGAETIESFKFLERDIPTSVTAFQAISVRDIYGIARYGETVPLSPEQIQGLALEGKVKPVKADASDTLKDSLIRSQLTPTFQPNNEDGDAPVPQLCSGGTGASSCSASGCSVTCKAGYYAICCSSCVCNAG